MTKTVIEKSADQIKNIIWKDVDDYIGLFSIVGRKVNTATQKIIVEQYGGESAIPYFITRVREHNEIWEQNHQPEDNEYDE